MSSIGLWPNKRPSDRPAAARAQALRRASIIAIEARIAHLQQHYASASVEHIWLLQKEVDRLKSGAL